MAFQALKWQKKKRFLTKREVKKTVFWDPSDTILLHKARVARDQYKRAQSENLSQEKRQSLALRPSRFVIWLEYGLCNMVVPEWNYSHLFAYFWVLSQDISRHSNDTVESADLHTFTYWPFRKNGCQSLVSLNLCYPHILFWQLTQLAPGILFSSWKRNLHCILLA